MKTYDEIFGVDERPKNLDIKLLEIQSKYKGWFDDNLGFYENGEAKQITDFRIIYNDPHTRHNKVIIEIENIPDEIASDINQAFNEIFK